MSSMASTGSYVIFTMDTIIIRHDAKYFSDLRQLLSSKTTTDLTIYGKDGSITIHKKAIQLNSSTLNETLERSVAIQFAEFKVTELVKVRNYAYQGQIELYKEDIHRFAIIAKAFGFDVLYQTLIRALNPEHGTADLQDGQEEEIQAEDSLQETEKESGKVDSLLTVNWKEPVIQLTRLSHSEIMKYTQNSSPLRPNASVKTTKIKPRTQEMTEQMLKWWLKEIEKGIKYFPASLLVQKFAAEGQTVTHATLICRKESLITLYQDDVEAVDEQFLPYLRQIEAKTNFVKVHQWKWSESDIQQLLQLWLDSKGTKIFPAKFIAGQLTKMGIKVSSDAVSQKKRKLLKMYLNHIKGKKEPKIEPFISLLRQIHSD